MTEKRLQLIFGNTTLFRLLDELIMNRQYRTMTQLARDANISRTTLLKLTQKLKEMNIISRTRRGRETLIRLSKNRIAKQLCGLAYEVEEVWKKQ